MFLKPVNVVPEHATVVLSQAIQSGSSSNVSSVTTLSHVTKAGCGEERRLTSKTSHNTGTRTKEQDFDAKDADSLGLLFQRRTIRS